MLSATAIMSRAKAEMAYRRVSAISRSVRRRRFSISASVRRSLSLYSALSFDSASTNAAILPSSVGPAVSPSAAGAMEGRAFVSVITSFLLASWRPFAPDIRAEAQKIKPVRPSRGNHLTADELAHDLGGVVDHRDHARIVEPRGTDHADDAD